jgi:hypothetical protein
MLRAMARLVEEVRRTNQGTEPRSADPSTNTTRKGIMSKISTRLAIVGACIAVTAGLMASIAGAAAAVTVPPNAFTTNAGNKTMTLNADITTDTTIFVPDGYTLNGNGHMITAIDGPSGAFNGAVVQNEGTLMHVKNLKIDGGDSAAAENCARVYNGVAFMAASGSIKGVTLTDIGLPETGCQIGRAILVHAFGSPTQQSVTIEGNTVSSYNKNGIDVRGNVTAKIVGNIVTGTASDKVARNGIVVRTDAVNYPNDVASAQVWGNTVSGNWYSPVDTEATGLLVIDATVNMTKKNTISGNEADIYNAGTIVGKNKVSA